MTVPGLHGSEGAHWQTWLERQFARSLRVEQADWDAPDIALWSKSLRDLLARERGPFVLAAHIVAATDLVALVPNSVVELFAATLPITAVDIPLDLPPLPISQTWHIRSSNDPAHRWLREQVAAGASQVMNAVHKRRSSNII